VVRSKTAHGYADAVNLLFRLRGFTLPANFNDAANETMIIVKNFHKEEKIASQLSLLDNKMFAQLQTKATKSKSDDPIDNLMFNITALGRYIGPRASEFAQKKQSAADFHTYPSGQQVIKSFVLSDFICFDRDGDHINEGTEDALAMAHSVRITWRIQKNRQNGQSIMLAADMKNPILCPVCNAMLMVMRARRLNQPRDMPVCVYSTNKNDMLYLTGAKVAQLFRGAVKSIRRDIPDNEAKRYSAHSLRVWACVLLDEAGKSPEFIKKCLRWMGDSFRMYLRDTFVINRQHSAALENASTEFLSLVALQSLPDVVPVDDNMGEYDDEIF